MFKVNLLKYWYLLPFSIFVIIGQIIVLKPHLEYGFSDVDWGYLSTYKIQHDLSLKQLWNNFKAGGNMGGVYTHQIYYIGIQEHFYGLDFKKFQMTTHIFKILATLACFPIFLVISGNRLIAVISTILFGFSYSAVGTMYTVVTSSDYSAVLSMGLFSFVYWMIIKKESTNWLLHTLCLILLMLTLFLSTERMYPLPVFILANEIFLLAFNRKRNVKATFMRVGILLTPVLLIFLIKPTVFLNFLFFQGGEIPVALRKGNWNIFLTPMIVLGSMVLPPSYVLHSGSISLINFPSYIGSLLEGPFIFIWLCSILLGLFISAKPVIFIIRLLIFNLISVVLIFMAGSNFTTHILYHGAIYHALLGGFLISVAIASFMEWLKYRSRILIGLFAGPFFAFIYIFLTWIAAHPTEVFAGIHRYLTIPSMGTSLFIATLLVIVSDRMFSPFKSLKLSQLLSTIPFLLIIPYININSQEIQNFFNFQLQSGFAASDKQLMRTQLNNQLQNLNSTKPSLFYFDFVDALE